MTAGTSSVWLSPTVRSSARPLLFSDYPIPGHHRRARSCLLAKQALQVEIEQNPLRDPTLLEAVQTNADTNRSALGFLPSAAYTGAAQRGNLFVAADRRGHIAVYVGHILFGATYPRAKIFQVYVATAGRGRGIGRLLVEYLLKHLEEKQFLSVSARVASELQSNHFWSALSFEIVGTQTGGASRGRTINIRARQLNTPALFGYRRPVTGLPLTEPLPNLSAVFALDLNVFFDVLKHRPRHDYGAAIMSAAFDGIVRLAVTEEFTNELRRTTTRIGDPLLEFALQLPTLPTPILGLNQQLIKELAILVFPERAAAGTLTVQDRSDLAHLAIAAHHKVTGFVTAEDALVRAANAIETKFGIRTLHVRDIAEALKSAKTVTSPLDIGFSERDLRMSEITETHLSAIRVLTDSVKLPRAVRGLALAEGIHATNRRSLVISNEDRVICAAFWEPKSLLHSGLEALLLVDEEQVATPVAVNALLNQLARLGSERGIARIQVIIPNSAPVSQNLAIHYGFRPCINNEPGISLYQRLSVGTPVNSKSWPSVRHHLRTSTQMGFAEDFTVLADEKQRVAFEDKDGTEFVIDLFDLETILSPTLFQLPDRNAVLVPIRATYADDMFGTAQQGSLLPRRQAAVLHERVYFSASRNERLLQRGVPVVFYESGKANGRSAAIVVARVISTVIIPKGQITASLFDAGVVDDEDLEDFNSGRVVAATTLDNVLKLRKPVSLKQLREFGCVDGANLVTSRLISAAQLAAIIEKGEGTRE
jgi:ribosomal protein S18 acetylase RimI-like enzyme